jgi:hypothetical protein
MAQRVGGQRRLNSRQSQVADKLESEVLEGEYRAQAYVREGLRDPFIIYNLFSRFSSRQPVIKPPRRLELGFGALMVQEGLPSTAK